MKRNIYHPAIGCSCGLHTWPTLLQSVCKKGADCFPLCCKIQDKTGKTSRALSTNIECWTNSEDVNPAGQMLRRISPPYPKVY